MLGYILSFVAGMVAYVIFIKLKNAHKIRKRGYMRLKDSLSQTHEFTSADRAKVREINVCDESVMKSKFDNLFEYGQSKGDEDTQPSTENKLTDQGFSGVNFSRERPRQDNVIKSELDNKFLDLSHLANEPDYERKFSEHDSDNLQKPPSDNSNSEWKPMAFFDDD